MEYLIKDTSDGKTVLSILKGELGFSHATVKHLKFKPMGISVGGKQVTVRYTVKAGDVLSLAVEDEQTPEKLTPSDLKLQIAYEDADAVVPNKPADMPTHQSFGHYGDTVANALSYKYTSEGIPFVFRPVNRLDRNTSGLLLIAKNRISAAYLSEAMREGRIRKQYIAILRGNLTEDSGVIDTYMRRTAESIIVRENCGEGEGGDRAITEYRVVCRSETHCMVCASPITGRTHQLRVHFAGLGCPIEGDDLYGAPSALIDRHALHSYMLTFPAKDGSEITVCASLHNDMLSLARAVFGNSIPITDENVKKHIIPKEEQ